MSSFSPDAVATSAALNQQIDAGPVRELLYDAGGKYRWPRFRVNEVELEWRRWRIRRHLGAVDDPPASIGLFEKLIVAGGGPPVSAMDFESAGIAPLTDSYDAMFPQGPLVTKALQGRVVRAPGERDDQDYARLLAESTRRRDAYLAKLDNDSFWWHIDDFVSAETLRRCAAELGELDPGAGMAFAGGPDPGWDVLHDALTSKSSNMYLGAGPTLVQIHEDPVLVADVSRRMGRAMYPTRCTYLRYRKGDFLGVHTDMPTCEVSLLFTVEGEAGPMRSYLDQATDTANSLGEWVVSEGQFPRGGKDFVYQPRECLALVGRATPHARLPQNDHAVIGAMFYSGLT